MTKSKREFLIRYAHKLVDRIEKNLKYIVEEIKKNEKQKD